MLPAIISAAGAVIAAVVAPLVTEWARRRGHRPRRHT